MKVIGVQGVVENADVELGDFEPTTGESVHSIPIRQYLRHRHEWNAHVRLVADYIERGVRSHQHFETRFDPLPRRAAIVALQRVLVIEPI